MDLSYFCGQLCGERRRFGRLEQTCRNYYMLSRKSFVIRHDLISICQRLNRCDAHIKSDGEVELLYIIFKISNDLGARKKAIRIIALIFRFGHLQGPVWRKECERIPALTAPRTARLFGLLEDNVFHLMLLKVITGRKSRLSAADDDRIKVLHLVSPS